MMNSYDFTTHMNSSFTVGDCPTLVGLEFTTTSPVGVTFSGTFDHMCTIPEPGSFAIFALAGSRLALRRGMRKAKGGLPRGIYGNGNANSLTPPHGSPSSTATMPFPSLTFNLTP